MMHSRYSLRARAVATVAALTACVMILGVPGVVHAEEALPEAENVLAAFVKAAGGKAAFDKIDNRVLEGKFEMPAAGITLDVTVYQSRAGKTYTVLASEALGKIERGTNGEVAWEISTMQGPVVREGAERDQALKEGEFERLVYWRDHFKDVKTVGIEDVEGRSCYKVEQTPTVGSVETYYYDAETGLVARVDLTVDTQMGPISASAYPDDYRKIDGIMVAHKNTVDVMQQKRVMSIATIEHNVDLPSDRFDLPPAIVEIVNAAE